MLQMLLLRGQTSVTIKLYLLLNKWEEKRREREMSERDREGKNKDPIFLGTQSTGQIQHSRFSWMAAEQNVQVYLHTKDLPCFFTIF